MKRFTDYHSNYDKEPKICVRGYEDHCWMGWKAILAEVKKAIAQSILNDVIVGVECYPGVNVEEILRSLSSHFEDIVIVDTRGLFKPTAEIEAMVYPDITDDEVFGYMTRLDMEDFFDPNKLQQETERLQGKRGLRFIVGAGASLLADADILIYADMPRWEAQLRFRRNESVNLGSSDSQLKASLQYKRAFFVDWRVADRLKRKLVTKWHYVLDTVTPDIPKMITAQALEAGLHQAVSQPFRLVPFFDPGPWGGQWMKEVCDLDKGTENFAWCFDCVPEENSLLLSFNGFTFEVPAINLVFFKSIDLLGEAVYGRFGPEFPIRFDFLDTMDGGNLSLQVHPSTGYIQEKFGMHYTQDESYYLLDAAEDAEVYLGLKEEVDPKEMIATLKDSQQSGHFDADKFVNRWKAKKHDHFLIPAGTVHCSGANSMVLEISATPYIFTFKLWDWGRLGLDGVPRPINIGHGKNVINWKCNTRWTQKNLVNQVFELSRGDGWVEERTGLHKSQFLETRRHWFSKTVYHYTYGNLNVLNLVEGREAIVESPTHAFSPFVVHYAETFVIPASIGKYTIRPYGESEGKTCATLKAYVRV